MATGNDSTRVPVQVPESTGNVNVNWNWAAAAATATAASCRMARWPLAKYANFITSHGTWQEKTTVDANMWIQVTQV